LLNAKSESFLYQTPYINNTVGC